MVSTSSGAQQGSVALGSFRRVLRVGLGTMPLCGGLAGRARVADCDSGRVLRRAIELGVNLIDTADVYGPETAELLIAHVLSPYPSDLVIATKGGMRVAPDRSWVIDGRPTHLRDACHASLRRLGLDCLPLYQLHAPDPDVPVAESVGALDDLRREGKVSEIGVCNVTSEQLQMARAAASIVSVQNGYNLLHRDCEGVIATCEAHAVPFLAWYPLDNGTLTRGRRFLARIAARHEATPAQVALAWLLSRSPTLVPIPGTTSAQHLEENVAAQALVLTDHEITLLDRLGQPLRAPSEANG